MAAPRLYLDAPFSGGARIPLEPEQVSYLMRVMRLEAGAPVRVFNGRDGEWRAELTPTGKKDAALTLNAQTRLQAATPDVWVLFAPVKRQATDWIVEKAAELGAARLKPVLTKRTIAETVRLDRLTAIAREAAEQTERLDLPQIDPPQALAAALDRWSADRPLIYADEAGDEPGEIWGGAAGRAQPILSALQHRKPNKAALLIGPEGGFDPAERRMLRGLEFVIPVSLGPRILRAETAVAAGLALIQAVWGDWRGIAEQAQAPQMGQTEGGPNGRN